MTVGKLADLFPQSAKHPVDRKSLVETDPGSHVICRCSF